MACRLVNLHTHPLHVDLRGGETLTLQRGETSRTLLEELLYDNVHLADWEKAGWIARLPARLKAAPPAAEAAADQPAMEAAAFGSRPVKAPAGKPPQEDEAAERPKPGAGADDKAGRGPAKK